MLLLHAIAATKAHSRCKSEQIQVQLASYVPPESIVNFTLLRPAPAAPWASIMTRFITYQRVDLIHISVRIAVTASITTSRLLVAARAVLLVSIPTMVLLPVHSVNVARATTI